MRAAIGQGLRLVGLLIEMACLMQFVSMRDTGQRVAGLSVAHLSMAGIVLGAILWVAGMFLILTARKSRRR
jgi:hypothetical protein